MIKLKCAEKDLNEVSLAEFEEENYVSIYNDDVEIGSISMYPCGDSLGLELVDIESEFRGRGFGTEAMSQLINRCRDFNMDYIHGDSPNIRKGFYKRLGAIYECRDSYDETFINDRFYIDL